MRASVSSYLPLCGPTGQSVNSSHVRVTRLLGRDSSLLKCRSPRVSYRRLGELYAVKSVRLGATPAERATQLREVVMHERVSSMHENIVGLKDCFFDSHNLYFVLDGVFGGNLQEAIVERARFFYDDGAVRSVFTQVVDAVAFCHAQALFHRDVRPSNILCSMDGNRVFLSNFGLATQKEESNEFGVGTLAYMCPEAVNSDREFESYSTRKGDIWALGIFLLNMLTGTTPWTEATVADTDFRHYLQSPSCSLNGMPISPDAKRLIRRVLHHNCAKRISAYELLARLPLVKTFFPTKEELRTASAHILTQVQRLMDCNIAGRVRPPKAGWTSRLAGTILYSPPQRSLDDCPDLALSPAVPMTRTRSRSLDLYPGLASGNRVSVETNLPARLDFCTSPGLVPASAISPGECLWQMPPWLNSRSRHPSVDAPLIDDKPPTIAPSKMHSMRSAAPLVSSVSRFASLPTFASAVEQMLRARSSSGLKEEVTISRSPLSPLDDAVLPQPELASRAVVAELYAVTTNPPNDTHIALADSAASIPQTSDVRSNSPAHSPATRFSSAELITSPTTFSTLSSEAWNELDDWTRPSAEAAELPEADGTNTPSAQVEDARTQSDHERLLSLPPSLLSRDYSVSQRLSALSVRSTTRAPSSPLSVLLPPGASLLRMLSRASAASSTSTPSPWTPATPTWFKLGAFARSLSSLAAEERVEKEDVRVVSSEHSAEDGAIQVASGFYIGESAAAAHFGAKFGARIAKLRFGLPSNASQVLS